MSMMRSFTTRRKSPEFESHMPIQLGRAASQRGGRPVTRTQISAPVALVSTTNPLSYNAPDIVKPVEHHNADSSSSEDSDGSGNSVHSRETDPTDISSPEASPVAAQPNHLSQYFKDEPVKQDISSSPRLPRRAPSHSKRAHEALSRKRSIQRERAISPIHLRSGSQASASIDMATSDMREPFGKELAQLDAVAEEFAAVRSEAQSETLWLKSRGLACLPASEYLNEIDGLVTILLDDRSPTVPDFSGWF